MKIDEAISLIKNTAFLGYNGDDDKMAEAIQTIEQLVGKTEQLKADYEILCKMYAKVNEDLCVRTKERDAAWNTASLLCEGFLDMPSGCDGCPLFDTMIIDEEGNEICALSRSDIDG